MSENHGGGLFTANHQKVHEDEGAKERDHRFADPVTVSRIAREAVLAGEPNKTNASPAVRKNGIKEGM
jgi:hypothetical protein